TACSRWRAPRPSSRPCCKGRAPASGSNASPCSTRSRRRRARAHLASQGPASGRNESAGMKAVIQRVSRARVLVGPEEVGAIAAGMLVLVCVLRGDGEGESRRLAEKIARFRFFADAEERMNLSALDLG